MGCPRRFELTRYHAEDLMASEAEVIREHLAGCERCRELLGELDRQRYDFLRMYPPDQVVPEILAEAVRRERSWLWRVRIWWWIKRGDFSP